MSYSFTVEAPIPEAATALRAKGEEVLAAGFSDDCIAGTRVHLKVAAAAVDLLLANVEPGGYTSVRISLSGHGNNDLKPSPSWANDCMTLAINFT